MSEKTNRDSDKFMLRMPDGMRDRIKAVADTNNRSMNAEIVSSLEEKYPDFIGEIRYMHANEDGVRKGNMNVEDISEHSSDLPLRPYNVHGVIDPKGIVRTSDGQLFMRVMCL
jgi:hypothetical protein